MAFCDRLCAGHEQVCSCRGLAWFCPRNGPGIGQVTGPPCVCFLGCKIGGVATSESKEMTSGAPSMLACPRLDVCLVCPRCPPPPHPLASGHVWVQVEADGRAHSPGPCLGCSLRAAVFRPLVLLNAACPEELCRSGDSERPSLGKPPALFCSRPQIEHHGRE